MKMAVLSPDGVTALCNQPTENGGSCSTRTDIRIATYDCGLMDDPADAVMTGRETACGNHLSKADRASEEFVEKYMKDGAR